MIRLQALKGIPRRKRRTDVKSDLLLVVGKMPHRTQKDAPTGEMAHLTSWEPQKLPHTASNCFPKKP